MIYLLPVKHDIQLGRNQSDFSKFIRYARQQIIDKNIALIGEEASEDDIKALSLNKSPLGSLAEEMEVEYLSCDPTDKQRINAGILTGEQVALEMARIRQIMSTVRDISKLKEEDKKFRSLMAKNEKRREEFWLNLIKGKKDLTTLFVCGAGHISTYKNSRGEGFDTVLNNNGWNVEILSNWFV